MAKKKLITTAEKKAARKKKLITTAERKAARKELLKARYKILRDLGFTVEEARKVRKQTKAHVFDTKNAYNKKTGKVKKTKKIKKVIEFVNVARVENNYEVFKKNVKYKGNMNDMEINTDTTLSGWGYLTRGKLKKKDVEGRYYKNETLKLVKSIKKDMKINTDQSFYMTWYMLKYNISYQQAKEDMISDEYFNLYVASKNYRIKAVAKKVKK